MAPMNAWIVFLGAGLGGLLRFGATSWSLKVWGPNFPTGTLLVNVLGSALMGILAGYFMFKGEVASGWRLFLTTGVLGGFTTFSAFSLDVMLLIERADWGMAALYVISSVALSVAGLAVGLLAMRAWLG